MLRCKTVHYPLVRLVRECRVKGENRSIFQITIPLSLVILGPKNDKILAFYLT